MSTLHIAPNRPVYVALVDPEGAYDFELNVGQYQTTSGETLTLPRQAVITLNALGPRPGEEIQITQVWSGRPTDPKRWVIALSTRAEQARAEAGEADTLTAQLEASIGAMQDQIKPVGPLIPISAPVKRGRKPVTPAELFDRGVEIIKGTGTYGPAPEPAVASVPRKQPPQAIPWNIAFREVSAWVSKELAGNGLQWSDEAQQAMCCTVLIAEVKAGRISTWERAQ